MNDEAQPESAAAGGVTAGQLLRQARETAGLHVATLAVALKVPVRKLEALEEDRYDLLPDAVFVRALASSVCRTLKIDPAPVLERLPQMATPRLVQHDEGINAPFRAPGDGPRQAWPEQVSRPVVLTVIALLLGALVLIFLPARNEEPPVANGNGKPAPAPLPAPMTAPPVVESVAPPAPPPVAMAPAAPAPIAMAPSALPAPAPAKPASAAASAAVSAASAPAGPASGIVTFRTKGQSWVKVTDAKGTTVFQKLMNAGESAGASGALPLSVTVGSAEATEVEVRGQRFELAPLARDNVARFEVK